MPQLPVLDTGIDLGGNLNGFFGGPGGPGGPGTSSVTITLWITDNDGNSWFSTDAGQTWDVPLPAFGAAALGLTYDMSATTMNYMGDAFIAETAAMTLPAGASAGAAVAPYAGNIAQALTILAPTLYYNQTLWLVGSDFIEGVTPGPVPTSPAGAAGEIVGSYLNNDTP